MQAARTRCLIVVALTTENGDRPLVSRAAMCLCDSLAVDRVMKSLAYESHPLMTLHMCAVLCCVERCGYSQDAVA